MVLLVVGAIKLAPILESKWHWYYLIAGALVFVYVYLWFQKFEIKTNS